LFFEEWLKKMRDKNYPLMPLRKPVACCALRATPGRGSKTSAIPPMGWFTAGTADTAHLTYHHRTERLLLRQAKRADRGADRFACDGAMSFIRHYPCRGHTIVTCLLSK
jgi:hypothetical protein